MGGLIKVTSASEFDKLIAGSNKPTVVDFFAEWCGPCKMVAPRYEQLASKHPNVQFLKVDVDQLSQVSGKYGVRAMPTFLFFNAKGVKINEVVGADINKVERIAAELAKAGGSTGFPKTGGRVLGTGAAASNPQGSWLNAFNRDNWAYIAFGIFFLYLYATK